MKFLAALALTLALATHAAAAPLHDAVKNNDFAAITALLEAGADPNAKDDSGRTPLHWATRKRRARVVTALLDAGANPIAKDNNGMTPIDYARTFGASIAITETLIFAAATPLHNAARQGDTAAVAALLEAGADPNAKHIYNIGATPTALGGRIHRNAQKPRGHRRRTGRRRRRPQREGRQRTHPPALGVVVVVTGRAYHCAAQGRRRPQREGRQRSDPPALGVVVVTGRAHHCAAQGRRRPERASQRRSDPPELGSKGTKPEERRRAARRRRRAERDGQKRFARSGRRSPHPDFVLCRRPWRH